MTALARRVRAYWSPPIRCSRRAHAWYVVARIRSWFRPDVDDDLAALEQRFITQFRTAYGRPGAALAWTAVRADRAWFRLQRWWWEPR